MRAQVEGGAQDYKAIWAEEYGIGGGVSGWTLVRKDLPPDRQVAAALGIFMETSEAFENWQGSWPPPIGQESSYSLEDLPSNLIGFYTALATEAVGRRSPEQQKELIKPICDAILDEEKDKAWSEAVLEEYQRFGLLNQKNYEWHPSYVVGGGAIDVGTLFGDTCVGGCQDKDRQWPWQLRQLEMVAVRSQRRGNWWWWDMSLDGWNMTRPTFEATSTPNVYAFYSPLYP
jgi:hypothetical protein